MLSYKTQIPYNANIYLNYIITLHDEGQSVYKIMLNTLHMSFELIKRAKYSGSIEIDGILVHSNYTVKSMQKLCITINEHRHVPCLPYKLAIDIIFEDENILVLNKPAPLPTLCGPIDTANTLQNAIYSYFNCPYNFMYRPVNRLDCGTSGLMIIAKNAYIQQYLQSILHSNNFYRQYIALCKGCIKTSLGSIDLPIAKISKIKSAVMQNGKQCKTNYRILKCFNNYSLINLNLQTGRTHQIRVHLAHIGLPIVGDYLYSQAHTNFENKFCLHSNYIKLKLPYGKIDYEFFAPPPKYFSNFVKAVF